MILAIVGYGDLGQQIKNIALATQKYQGFVFFDDFADQSIEEVYGKISDIPKAYQSGIFDELVIAIGYKHLSFKAQLFDDLKSQNIPLATIIHPQTNIDPSAKVMEGSVIHRGCVLDEKVCIEENVFVNISSSISHDSLVKRHSFIAPKVAIAGFCSIGSKNIIGINSTIIDHIQTVDNVQTGGGTVVIKNIDEPGVYVGNPQRKIK